MTTLDTHIQPKTTHGRLSAIGGDGDGNSRWIAAAILVAALVIPAIVGSALGLEPAESTGWHGNSGQIEAPR